MDFITYRNLPLSRFGLGTYSMGEDDSLKDQEIDVLRSAIFSNGINVIDTAEMYGEGKAEKLIGTAFKPSERSHYFLISKIYPWNATKEKMKAHCEDSLKRLNTDYIDLYLLHWKGEANFATFVEEAEKLRKSGLIKHWGVSNFNVKDMEKLLKIPGGENCYADEILYHLGARGIEYDLLPYLKEHGILAIGYSPMADSLKRQEVFLKNPTMVAIAKEKGISVQNLLLLFAYQQKDLIILFKSSSKTHFQENLKVADLTLTEDELTRLNEAFPAPNKATPLETI